MGKDFIQDGLESNTLNIKQSKKIFALLPILIPESQNVKILNKLNAQNKNIAKKLLNKTIKDVKVKS